MLKHYMHHLHTKKIKFIYESCVTQFIYNFKHQVNHSACQVTTLVYVVLCMHIIISKYIIYKHQKMCQQSCLTN